MSTPVYEEQRLGNYSRSPSYNAALPLRPPKGPASTQGLQLATNGDVLVGCANNGVILCLPSDSLRVHIAIDGFTLTTHAGWHDLVATVSD